MSPIGHRVIRILFVLGLLLGVGCSGPAEDTTPAPEAEAEQPAELETTTTPWWQMSDQEFAETYASQAFSDDLTEQSTVAWMIFARVNEQVPNPFGGTSATVSEWETWPSDADTFSSSSEASFEASAKQRAMPQFVVSKKARSGGTTALEAQPNGGEEVTRNKLGYDYIRGHGLNTLAGIEAKMNEGFAVDLPIGAIEIKGNWASGAQSGAYTFEGSGGTFSLIGLHIGMKMKPTPADPFTSEDPSWFWTTFEFENNPLRPDLEPFVTYKDQLSPEQADKILGEAGLGSTNFVNYLGNGTQIRYSDASHPDIVLGNSTMEAFAAVPSSGPPYTAWNSSCHNCHGQVAMNRSNNSIPIFTVEVGTITNRDMTDWYPLDFVWGFLDAQ